MVGFRYQGKTTENIIDTPLLLVSYDSSDTFGSNRSKIEGDMTISRPVTNEYGTMYDPLSFSYALIKQNYEPFTEEEQVTVERWLTSPKLSSELTIINCEGGEYSYFGLFINTNWSRASGDFAICGFTFQVNGAYPYRHINQVVWNGGATSSGDFAVQVDTDELEEYIYPTITFEPSNNNNVVFSLYANSDSDGGYMNVTTAMKLPVHVDCQHCRAYTTAEGASGKITITNLRFKDLNWQDVDNVYWPRLKAGDNQFHVDGNVKITFDYYAPYKKVGGQLV